MPSWMSSLTNTELISLLSVICVAATAIFSSIATVIVQVWTNQVNKQISRAEHRHNCKADAYASFLTAADLFLRDPSEKRYDSFSSSFYIAKLYASGNVLLAMNEFAKLAYAAEDPKGPVPESVIEAAFESLGLLRAHMASDLSGTWSEPLPKWHQAQGRKTQEQRQLPR